MTKPVEIEIHPGHWKNTGSEANGILNEVTGAHKVAKLVYDILRSGKFRQHTLRTMHLVIKHRTLISW